MTVVLKTLKNVPILEVGVEYELMTGKTTFTPEDLRDVVTAANEDHSIPSPRAAIGHVDPRYNNIAAYDGTPAFGKYINLRLSDNGMTVYADWAGCPAWLAEIGPAAFPGRSIEGFWNVQSQAGKKWRFVLSSVKSLGVVWPGCPTLEDLPLYYGEELPPGVVVDEEAVAASIKPGGDPMGVQASANLDDVRRAFYMEYMPANVEARYWWVRAVLTDPNELIVEDDETGQLYKLPFSSDDQSAVSFGDPDAVRIDYVPDTREAQKAAASHVAATLAVGRKVAASWPSRAESCPTNASGGARMDPKEIRKRLDLPEDASDEQVQEALLAKAGIGEQPSTEGTPTPPAPAAAPEVIPAEHGGVTPVSTGTPEPATTPEQVAAAAATQVNLPPGTVLIDEATLASLKAGATAGTTLLEKQEERDRETLVAAAIGDGRIPGARKDHWINYLKQDAEGGKAALASMQPGLVPVNEIGHGGDLSGGTGVTQEEEQKVVSGWTESLFPEVAAAKRLEAAIEAGTAERPHIMADRKYARR